MKNRKIQTQLTNEIWQALDIAEDEGREAERERCCKIVERAMKIDPDSKALKFCLGKIEIDPRTRKKS